MSIVKVESWLCCLLPYTGPISYVRLRVFCCVCFGEAKEKVEGWLVCRFVRRPACESGMKSNYFHRGSAGWFRPTRKGLRMVLFSLLPFGGSNLPASYAVGAVTKVEAWSSRDDGL